MKEAMAVDGGFAFSSRALPTPNDTPHQTPSKGIAHQGSLQNSPPTFSSSPPAAFASEGTYFADMNRTESISSFNNPRFSQNLDISFIGEIHTLKKELERKEHSLEVVQKENKLQKSAIGDLEEAIETLASELTQLRDDVKNKASRQRSLERRNRLLQDDSTSALDETIAERDRALGREADLRKTLEVEKAKKRSLEADLENVSKQQDEERQKYEKESRNTDMKNHVLEARIKNLVMELHTLQASQSQFQNSRSHLRNDSIQESVRSLDTANMRSASRMSTRSSDEMHIDRDAMESRASKRSLRHGLGGSRSNGLSLAEELGGEDTDEEDDRELIDDAPSSPGALLEESFVKSSRYSEDEKARKVMGLNTDTFSQRSEDVLGKQILRMDSEQTAPLVGVSTASYANAGTQVTPPLPPQTSKKQTEKANDHVETAADQSRKRVAVPQIFAEQESPLRIEPNKAQTVSVSTQTDVLATQSTIHSSMRPQGVQSLARSTSTQTANDDVSPGKPTSSNSLSPSKVPVIAIHPPASRPSSSHNSVVLPPRTRNAASQVEPHEFRSTTSSSMQTEEIRVDRRPVKLPPRARAAPFMTRPRSPARARSRSIEKRYKSFETTPPKIPRRKLRSPPPLDDDPTNPPVPQITKAYPGNNDDGPLTSQSPKGPRRPVRSGSLFAGFDDTIDEISGRQDDDSDDGFLVGPPIKKTLSKVQDSWKLVPQSDGEVFDGPSSAAWNLQRPRVQEQSDKSKQAQNKAPRTTSKTFHSKSATQSTQSSSSKSADTRKSAPLFPSQKRSRSPSGSGPGLTTAAPPFPVPTRSSSRKIPISSSEGAASPTPYSTSFFTSRNGQEKFRHAGRRKSLRKTQSATAVTKSARTTSRKPPPLPSYATPAAAPVSMPKVSPPSQNQFILPYPEDMPDSRGGSEASELTRSNGGEASIETANAQTSVVDAIAQTMVGEWMWKYIRKRTSFGITENAQADFDAGKTGENRAVGGVRHKRWVWLAPYERAVIWSNKQPTSGPALLGKGGRKLTIQSVLDVKDDTPLPKGSAPTTAFNRSILILTPERALKFTAVTEERHYIWLTALSFLSHPTQGMDDLAVPEPIPQPDYQRQRPPSREYGGIGPRRSQVRDSIRIAKAKSRPTMGPHSFSSPPGDISTTYPQMDVPWDDIAERPSEDAAEPPQIPRVAAHMRKRSSTGSRVPLGSITSLHNSIIANSSSSGGPGTIASTDKEPRSSRGESGSSTRRNTLTRSQIVEASPPPVPPLVRNDFFDAVGTVRMEAFIGYGDGNKDRSPPPSSDATREPLVREHKKVMSYWGVPESPGIAISPTTAKWREDPFRGF